MKRVCENRLFVALALFAQMVAQAATAPVKPARVKLLFAEKRAACAVAWREMFFMCVLR